MIIGSVEPEHEGKYNPAQIAAGTYEPRNDSVIAWMHMWDNGEVCTVGCVGENGADGNGCNEGIDFDIGNETDGSQ